MKYNWYPHDDGLSISLMRFYARIKFILSDEKIDYQLYVKNGEESYDTFDFNSFKEAVFFLEEVVSKCYELSEVRREYDILYKVPQKTIGIIHYGLPKKHND